LVCILSFMPWHLSARAQCLMLLFLL